MAAETQGSSENLAAAIREIQATARQAVEPKLVNVTIGFGQETADVPFLVHPGHAGSVQVMPLLEHVEKAIELERAERLLGQKGPDRREGKARHHSLQSFIDHANRFKAPESVVWADSEDLELVSVLDYHLAGATADTRWGKHRGAYSCPLSAQWEAWGGEVGLVLTQEKFAELLDARDRELCDGKLPSGALAPFPSYLISMAHNLEVFSTAKARRERDPNTGRLKLTYSEEKGVLGDIQPPTAFLIRIPIFQDGAPQEIEVRLRVDVDDGAAKFTVRIHAAAELLREAFLGLCERVQLETSLDVFQGVSELG